MSTLPQIAKSPSEFHNFMTKLKPQIAAALPAHMNPERMQRLALTAFSGNKDLQQCDLKSIFGSIITAAQLGLEPGVNGAGYLIPYKGKCTFVPGWKGLVDLVARSGRATVWTGAVFDGDEFDYQLGDDPFCRHKPRDGDDEKFTHVYAIGRVRDAQMPVIEVWTRAKVEKHLKKYNKVGGRHYALADENNFEMYARKVALLQVLKYMPSSIELSNAITASHAAEAGRGVTIENGIVIDLGDDPSDAPAAPSLPECTKESFAKQSADWKAVITSGRKTVNELISFIEGRETLNDDQKMEIASWKAAGETA